MIVGAGVAGLVAGYELKRAGHNPVILEAQQRVGGGSTRCVIPSQRASTPRSVPCAYCAHSLTMAYVSKFELKTNDFTMDNPNGYLYMGGNKVRASGSPHHPALLGFDVSEQEKGQDREPDVHEVDPAAARHARKDGDAAWGEIVAKHDQYSAREFLEREGWSEGMIEMFGLLANQESVMNSSFSRCSVRTPATTTRTWSRSTVGRIGCRTPSSPN